MKKWLILLLVISSVSTASTISSWEFFSAPHDNWISGKTMARLAVPHGWLLHTRFVGTNGSISQNTTYIPDENHEWVLEPSLTQELSKPN